MIARTLLAQGKPVRILVREGSPYQDLAAAGAEPVVGDLKDRPSLDRACAGVDTVLTTANSAGRGGADTPESVEMEGNRNLIDAAKAAGVKHFIFVTALGADVNSPIPFMRGKAMTEQYLLASGMPYTILAPNIFLDVWAGAVIGGPLSQGQPVTLVGEGRRQHSFISAPDVAAFVAAAVDNPAAKNRYLPLGGPEPVSWRDVAASVERVVGRPIAVQSVMPGEPVPGMPEFMSGMLAFQDTYDSPIDMSETARIFGVRQETLDGYAQRAFGNRGASGDAP
jgi:NADH dehydrogenase